MRVKKDTAESEPCTRRVKSDAGDGSSICLVGLQSKSRGKHPKGIGLKCRTMGPVWDPRRKAEWVVRHGIVKDIQILISLKNTRCSIHKHLGYGCGIIGDDFEFFCIVGNTKKRVPLVS